MHARWLVPPIVAALLVAGCGRPEPEPAERAEAARAPALPPEPAPADARCTLGEPRVALATEGPVSALGLAHGEGGTVLVATLDPATLAWVRLDGAGEALATVRAPFPRARGLVAAAPFGERTAAVGHGPCPEGTSAPACLHLAVLDGGRVLDAVSVPLPGRVERFRLAASPDLLVVARSHATGPAYADLVRVADGRLAVESVRFADARFPGAHHVEALAAAASGDRYAVALRVGAIEDPTGALVLATREGLFELEPLHEAAMVDALVFEPARPTHLALLASFEWSRPRIYRVTTRGEVSERPVEVPHGAEAGPPFEAGEVGRLARDADGLSLTRQSLGGDALGAPVPIAGPEPSRAALAKRGPGRFVLAIAPGAEPFGVRTLDVRCADTPQRR